MHREAMLLSKPATSCYHPCLQAPERILDAPDITDDYYLNLLDWSSLNTVLTPQLNAPSFAVDVVRKQNIGVLLQAPTMVA